jgi:hypothetical protein
MAKKLNVTARLLSDGRTFIVKGRDGWALLELEKAGPRGCTPLDNPGPRWSAYVFNLKREHGLAIETKMERHCGEFPGSHARYILHSAVEITSHNAGMETEAAS